MKPTTPKVTASITKRLTQQKGSVMPLVSGFVSDRLSEARPGSASERLAAMKSGKVDSAAKVAPRPVPHSTVTDSSAEKGKFARRAIVRNPLSLRLKSFPRYMHSLRTSMHVPSLLTMFGKLSSAQTLL